MKNYFWDFFNFINSTFLPQKKWLEKKVARKWSQPIEPGSAFVKSFYFEKCLRVEQKGDDSQNRNILNLSGERKLKNIFKKWIF